MALHHLIYLSTPAAAWTPQQLSELLTACRVNNQQRGLTGLLLYGPGHFLQLLEGEADQVHALYAHLHHDPRHRNLIKVADKPIEVRAFPDWLMAFHCLADEAPVDGFHLLESLSLDQLALPAADTLLLSTVRKQLLAA